MQKKRASKKRISEKKVIKTVIFHCVLLFLAGSVVGSIVDTAYQSLLAGHFSYSSFFGMLFGFFVPFLPVYGFGLVAIYLLFSFAKKLSLPAQMLLYAASLTTLEFIAGFLVESAYGVRLWDYSASRFNVSGYVDTTHTFYWIVLALGAQWGLEKMGHRFALKKNRF